MRIGWVYLSPIYQKKVLLFISKNYPSYLSMVWLQLHGCISNRNPNMLYHYHLLNMDCFIRNLSTSIHLLWEHQLSFHTSLWRIRGGLSPFLHPILKFRRSVSRNGIVNGRDALVLARSNGTLVGVSNLEGTPFFYTPFFTRELFFDYLFFYMV